MRKWGGLKKGSIKNYLFLKKKVKTKYQVYALFTIRTIILLFKKAVVYILSIKNAAIP